MKRIIDLSGTWKLSGSNADGAAFAIDAAVPGCVHTDLLAHQLIPDPFYRDNSKAVQWIESHDFSYSKTFTVESLSDHAYLEFDGLDTYCEIYLNGQKIASCHNMFIPHEFCVDGILKEGENHLSVTFRSPVREVADRPRRSAAFTKERVHTRRIQCSYGWDWLDRFVTMGIWRAARVVFRERNEIDNLYVYTNDITPYCAQLKLELNIRDFADCGDTVHIEILSPDGVTVFEKERVLLAPHLYEFIDIPSPKLWFPHGYGEQPLYTVRLSTPTSQKEEQIGIRKVTIIQIEDPEDSEYRAKCKKLESIDYIAQYEFNSKTSGFIILVNGIKIMCKGANWVPSEPFPSAETPEKICRLLDFAVEGGLNILRVWGGGIFECDTLYEECDKRGILMTQDFLMACGHYPEEEDWFIKELQKEATAAVLRLRNHPCLVYWSGDNENAVLGSENRNDFMGYLAAAKGLEPVVTTLDPARRFFPSSPYGGDFYCCSTKGTTHNTYFLGPVLTYLNEEDLCNYRKLLSEHVSRFCAEQGAFGMSFVSSLKKYLTEEDIFGEDSALLIHHTKTAPSIKGHLFKIVERMASKLFGEFTDGADRIRKMQMAHCEWVRITFELYRRNKGFSWGLIYWMFNDCWPASAGWALLDYYACPKPAYYTFKRCAKPVIACIAEDEGRLSVHVSNDSLMAVKGNATLYLYDFENDCELLRRDIPFDADPNATCEIFAGDYTSFENLMTDKTVLLCDLTSASGTDRAFFIPKRFSDLSVSYADPIILSETEETITVTANHFLPYVMLDVPYLLSDNCFPLKKGEIKTLKKIRKL